MNNLFQHHLDIARVSCITRHFQEIPEHQRADAVESLAYEANARISDPIYGCTGAIFALQNQINELQQELAKAKAEILLLNAEIQNSYSKSYISMEMSQQQCTYPQLQPGESSCFSAEDGNASMPIGDGNGIGLEQFMDEEN